MKKHIPVIILIFSFMNSFSQVEKHKVEIQNKVLKIKLNGYKKYIEDFSFRNNIKYFALTMEEKKTGDTTFISLDILQHKELIQVFNPSRFSLLGKVPVLIRTTSQSSSIKNYSLIEFIKFNYFNAPPNEEDERKLKEEREKLPDTITVVDRNGDKVKIPSTRIKPVIVRGGGGHEPKTLFLAFKGERLIEEKWDKYEKKTQ